MTYHIYDLDPYIKSLVTPAEKYEKLKFIPDSLAANSMKSCRILWIGLPVNDFKRVILDWHDSFFPILYLLSLPVLHWELQLTTYIHEVTSVRTDDGWTEGRKMGD